MVNMFDFSNNDFSESFQSSCYLAEQFVKRFNEIENLTKLKMRHPLPKNQQRQLTLVTLTLMTSVKLLVDK